MSSIMFGEKTLTDVVKGIRASKRDVVLYISQCIAEIKTELQSSDMYVKANALQKLTFLQMMGYSMSWASFASIEVMSSPRFAHKRIGYLAASQGFTQDTEVILLTTNLLKKELRGVGTAATSHGATTSMMGPMQGVYEAGLAINCIANIVTEDLARDLLPELTTLSQHSQPYLRKKAILCMYKVFLKYPQGLRLTFGRLQQALQTDANPAVVSCAVNVITELSDKNPTNYLHLAPTFFTLLTQSTNNWMLIKVVKLLGSLVPCEPRLARKLLQPLSGIVQHTQAKSLLYEAVYTITLCLPYCAKKSDGSLPANVPEIVQLCATTLRSFVEEPDQNLKYLGLVGFASLLTFAPRVISAPDYRPLILACLSDQDVTIRTRALELLSGVASRKNLMELVSQLLQHVQYAATGQYQQDLVAKIIQLCSADKYALLQDNFAWYFDLLLNELGRLRGMQVHAAYIAHQLEQVPLRVLPVRTHCVKRSMRVLLEGGNNGSDGSSNSDEAAAQDVNTSWMSSGGSTGMAGAQDDNGRGKHVMPELLPSLAWIVGEYGDLIPQALQELENDDDEHDDNEALTFDDSTRGPYHALVQVLTTPTNVPKLASETQVVYLQAACKILAVAASQESQSVKNAELTAIIHTISTNLPIYMQSTNVQVVERAFTALQLLKSLNLIDVDSSMPGLSALSKDENDDDSSTDDNDKDGAASGSGDLLGLGGEEGTASGGVAAATNDPMSSLDELTSTSPPTAVATTTTKSSSLPSRVRKAAPTLNYIFKSSPMKPLGAKAQRKKQSNPIGHAVDLEAPVDLSVFQDLIDEEASYRAQTKINMESISFTQQHVVPVKEQQAPAPSSGAPMPGFGGGGGGPFDMTSGFGSTSNQNEGGSFQNTSVSTGFGSNSRQRQGDPFYLGGGEDFGGGGTATTTGAPGAADPASRFGTIQLLDDGDDDDDLAAAGQSRKKPSKKKKSKRSKREAAANVDTSGSLLSFGDVAGTVQAPAAGSTTPAMYDSEEEEEEEEEGINYRPARAGRKAKRGNKEFAGLAKVDLTTPLREDEVMPERKHRVVPDNPAPQAAPVAGDPFAAAAAAAAAPQEPLSSKSKKKLKKEKKKASKKKGARSGAEVDLLDLGGFGVSEPQAAASATSAAPPVSAGQTAQPSAPVMANSSNPINTAFDDLLGLSAPAPAPTLGGGGDFEGMQLATPSQSGFTDIGSSSTTATPKGKRPWMKASIKLSSASGPPSLDWSKVSLSYRVHRTSKGDGVSAMVVFRVDNDMPATTIDGLELVLKGQSSTTIGSIGPGSCAETKKVGPFAFPNVDAAPELKGTLRTSTGNSVSVKVQLPVSVHLAPQENLSLEQVAEELSNQGSWSSHSTKVEFSTGQTPEAVKQIIGSFLRAALAVESAPSSNNCTFASVSASGARVRALVKVKESSVKIDLRCTNPSLGQALALDLKKVVL